MSWAMLACAVSAGQLAMADTECGSYRQYNYDFRGTRNVTEEHVLDRGNVSGLHVLWKVDTAGPVNGTPVVADGVVYVGDGSGVIHALTTDGAPVWTTTVAAGVTATMTIAGNVLVFGDQGGTLYGLKRNNGSVIWSFRPDPHPLAAIWGSGVLIGNNVAIGVASNEEFAAQDPNYPCCSSRGSLLLLDPKNGHVVWQTPTITDAQIAAGSSGASIWSTPTYDPDSKTIYTTTGNNFTEPTTLSENAFVAFDARTGAIKWINQRTPNDTWNYRFGYEPPDHVDADFGDSPQVYRLPNGRKVVGAGQKSGFYHVLDADTGVLINQIQVEPGGTLGGLFADTAVADGVVYANGINWPGLANDPSTAVAGDLVAISGDGSTELWRFTTPGSPDVGGVAVANGVVYFISSFNGNLYGLDTRNGSVLATVPLGVSFNGPSIADGRLYAGIGIDIGNSNFPGAIYGVGL
jgi:polyvinyl alcohol dehydrogenase (cytochrome)